jgi:hypothetical protein
MRAAWPWHERRESPPSASWPALQALGSSHKNPEVAARNPSHPCPFSFPPSPHQRKREERRRSRRRARGGGRRRHCRSNFPEPAPRATTPANLRCPPLLRLATAPSLRRTEHFPPSAPPVSITAAAPSLSPSAAGDADGPFVARP